MRFSKVLTRNQAQPARKWLPLGCRFLATLMVSAFVFAAQAELETAKYQHARVAGFDLLVHPQVAGDVSLFQRALQRLREKISEGARLMGESRIKPLRERVRFWLEPGTGNDAMVFHPSRAWLAVHGRNPDKAHGIEITNVANFLKWNGDDQPMMVVHELSHAYMFLVLGEAYAPLKEAWAGVLTEGLYQSVPYIHGGVRRAYALTNANEYFAEITESYLGTNDYFPYNEDQLKEYDPSGYKLMQQVWGARSLRPGVF